MLVLLSTSLICDMWYPSRLDVPFPFFSQEWSCDLFGYKMWAEYCFVDTDGEDLTASLWFTMSLSLCH